MGFLDIIKSFKWVIVGGFVIGVISLILTFLPDPNLHPLVGVWFLVSLGLSALATFVIMVLVVSLRVILNKLIILIQIIVKLGRNN